MCGRGLSGAEMHQRYGRGRWESNSVIAGGKAGGYTQYAESAHGGIEVPSGI